MSRLPFFSALLFWLALATQIFAAESERFKAGEELLDAWRISEAEELAVKALQESGKSAPALDFDARLKFYQGRYSEALAQLERARASE